MRHVFVETNWVVEWAAPEYRRLESAISLARKAVAGEIALHVPSICLTEARYPIRTKYQPRSAGDLRKYAAWARASGVLGAGDVEAIRVFINGFEQRVQSELDGVDGRLEELRSNSGIEVFGLSEVMLERMVDLSGQSLNLQPFDQAVLAAVITRAAQLRSRGETDIVFCEMDSDLHPWSRNGPPKQPLAGLYDAAGVWVYQDFEMINPPRPAGWTGTPL